MICQRRTQCTLKTFFSSHHLHFLICLCCVPLLLLLRCHLTPKQPDQCAEYYDNLSVCSNANINSRIKKSLFNLSLLPQVHIWFISKVMEGLNSNSYDLSIHRDWPYAVPFHIKWQQSYTLLWHYVVNYTTFIVLTYVNCCSAGVLFSLLAGFTTLFCLWRRGSFQKTSSLQFKIKPGPLYLYLLLYEYCFNGPVLVSASPVKITVHAGKLTFQSLLDEITDI